MRRRVASLAAAAALLVASAVSATPVAAPQRAGSDDEPRPGTGSSPAIAVGAAEVVAWLQLHGGNNRVAATVDAGAAPVLLGPPATTADGDDGAPAAVAGADGSVWVMAARSRREGRRLWLQRYADGRWHPPVDGPAARRFDHHPALAAAPGGGLWAAWIGEDGAGATARALHASRWNGDAWSPPETLPRGGGAPMAPAIAVDAAGTPFIAWAAGEGAEAEIRVSARRGGRWSAPRALSRNRVPDLMPSLAATGDGLLAAWITYTDDGYLPRAALRTDSDWAPPVTLATAPGGRPRAVDLDGRATVFWRRLQPQGGGTISARRLGNDGWGAEVTLADVSGSPFAAAGGVRPLLAFARADGRLGIVAGERGAAEPLIALATAAAPFRAAREAAPASALAPTPAIDEASPRVPESYTAFGDSITNGVVYDPERRTSEGYREPLQQMLRAFFRLGTVFNAGVDGESTTDGVGRIDNAIRSQDPQVILIMEGTNDILAAIDVSVIAFNLRRMVQRSYEEKPDILPFLAQLPPRLDPGPEGFDGPGNGRIDELNFILPLIGEEEGAVIVDMNTPIDGHPELMSNHVHPSVAGYEVMAQQWYDAIQPVVLDRTNRGDLDGSGRTDGLDLVRLALAFGALAGEDRYDDAADINGDGIVDGFDLDLLIELFGREVGEDDGGGGS